MCCAVCHCSVVSDSLWPHGLYPARLLGPWGFSRQEYWSDCHALLQGSSQPRDGTQVFHISGRFFTIWAMLCQLYIIRGKMNFYLSLTLYRKINSKWIIDLNVSDTTLMLLEEYVKRITFWVFFQGWQSFLKQSSSHKEEKNKLD